MKATWLLPDLPSTQQLGKALAHSCPWSEVQPRMLFLSGELGAGKTTLAAAMLHALGVLETVRSPSYSLIELYPVPAGQVAHVDLYRLQGVLELEQLGLRDLLQERTLLLIEWPERGAGALAAPDLALQLQSVPCRQVQIQSRTAPGEAWLTDARQRYPAKIEN